MSNFVKKNVIMDAEAMRRAIVRISHEIIERNKGVDNVVIVGIRTRGVPIAERLAAAIKDIENVELPVGMLDITLYRDDLSTLAYNPIVHGTEIDLDLNGKTINKLRLIILRYHRLLLHQCRLPLPGIH